METSLESMVEIVPIVPLGPMDQLVIDKLNAFEAPYLEEKMLVTGDMPDSETFQQAFTEFKKYAALHAISGEKLAMMSETIDKVWHQFILFTEQYTGFCNEILGGYMHHRPKTSYTPLDKNNKRTLTSLYKETFGQPHPLWDIKSDCSSCNNGCSSSGMCSSSCSSSGGD